MAVLKCLVDDRALQGLAFSLYGFDRRKPLSEADRMFMAAVRVAAKGKGPAEREAIFAVADAAAAVCSSDGQLMVTMRELAFVAGLGCRGITKPFGFLCGLNLIRSRSDIGYTLQYAAARRLALRAGDFRVSVESSIVDPFDYVFAPDKASSDAPPLVEAVQSSSFDEDVLASLLRSDAVNRTVFMCDHWAEIQNGYSAEVNEAASRLFDGDGRRVAPPSVSRVVSSFSRAVSNRVHPRPHLHRADFGDGRHFEVFEYVDAPSSLGLFNAWLKGGA